MQRKSKFTEKYEGIANFDSGSAGQNSDSFQWLVVWENIAMRIVTAVVSKYYRYEMASFSYLLLFSLIGKTKASFAKDFN